MARPRKDIKPTISVIVVNITVPASAGSMLMDFNKMGNRVPESAAAIRFIAIARPIIRAIVAS